MANLSSTRIFGDGTVERSLYVKQRLGVGVGSPDYAVDVFGDIRLNAEGSGNGKAQVRFNEGSGTSAYIGYDGENLNGGDNRLEFSSNGTHMVIQNRGRVGIGTTSPSYKLDVNQTGNEDDIARFIDDDNNSFIFKNNGAFTIDGDGGRHLTIQDNGDVGINTSSPGEKLDVNGTIRSEGIDIEGGDPGHINRDGAFYRTGGQAWITVDDNLYIRNQGDGGNSTFAFEVDEERFYLGNNKSAPALSEDKNSSGNLQVGNGSNGYAEVEAQDYYIHEDNLWLGDHVDNDDAHHPDHRDGVDFIEFDNDERSDHDGQDGRLFWDLSEGLYISSSNSKTGSTSVLQWSRSNVTAGSNVSVNYDSRGRPTISASGGGNTYTDSDAIDAIESNSNKLNMSAGIDIQSNGNIDSVNKLNVSTIDSNNGDGHIDWKQPVHFNGNGGNNESYEVRISGKGLRVDDSVRATGDVIAFYSSDRRLKKNPTKVENPMTKIEKLTGVGFGWKEKASREGKGFGVFAHDAKSIDERLVRKQGDGYLGVDYQQLHGIEIEALKQVNEKTQENQSQIKNLENKIEQLQTEINQLKQ